LKELRPFFVELWRRINKRRIPNIRTKLQASQLIGCSVRWLQAIVAGKTSKPKKAERPELTDEQLAFDIGRYVYEKLQKLMSQDRNRGRRLYSRLADYFERVSKGDGHDLRVELTEEGEAK